MKHIRRDHMKKNTRHFQKGFTLIEVLVSLLIFSVVVVMAVGAIFSLVDAGEKARELNSVMENLNIALETMARTVRSGTQYSVSGSNCTSNPTPVEGPASSFHFQTSSNNIISLPSGLGIVGITYSLSTNGQILETLDYGNGSTNSTNTYVTAAEVHVQSLTFWLYNCAAGSQSSAARPSVLVAIQGYAETRQNNKVNFNIQTTMTER